jgi:hypothetical protein
MSSKVPVLREQLQSKFLPAKASLSLHESGGAVQGLKLFRKFLIFTKIF